MAKYFIHNNEQELTIREPKLLSNVPSEWTVIEYQNPGEQADISGKAEAVEAEAGLTINGTPSIVVQLNCYKGLLNADGTENTTRENKWVCILVHDGQSWADIEQEMVDWVARDDAIHDTLKVLK